MRWLLTCRLALALSALLCTPVYGQRKPVFTSPLPTGVRLDPAGEGVDLGSLPIHLVLAPERDKAVLADGTLAYLGRIEVGRRPSALAVSGNNL